MSNPIDDLAKNLKAAVADHAKTQTQPQAAAQTATTQNQPQTQQSQTAKPSDSPNVDKNAQSAPPKVPTTDEMLFALLAEVKALKEAKAQGDMERAKLLAKASPKEIDWSKITEKDIVNLDIDIPVVMQERPAYMEVHILDKMCVVRWIHKMPQRLGACLAEGWQYIRKEDMDPAFPVWLEFDANGTYSHGDVVAMKILKSRYYPALKSNYLKTMAIHGKARLRQAVEQGKSGVQLDQKGNEIRLGGLEPEHIDTSRFSIFDPGDEPTKGEKEYTRDMVTL